MNKSTIEMDQYGNTIWSNSKGDWHNENGPAFISFDQNHRLWYINGLQHRENGPAGMSKINYGIQFFVEGKRTK